MTDLGIFMMGIVVLAVALAGTVAATMAKAVEDDDQIPSPQTKSKDSR